MILVVDKFLVILLIRQSAAASFKDTCVDLRNGTLKSTYIDGRCLTVEPAQLLTRAQAEQRCLELSEQAQLAAHFDQRKLSRIASMIDFSKLCQMKLRQACLYPCVCSTCCIKFPDKSKRPHKNIDTIRTHLKKDGGKKVELKGCEGYYVRWPPFGQFDREFITCSEDSSASAATVPSTSASHNSPTLDLEAYFAQNPHITKGQLFSEKFLTSPDGNIFNIEILVKSLHRFLKKNEHSENVDFHDAVSAVLSGVDIDNLKDGTYFLDSKHKLKYGIEKFLTPILNLDICINECCFFEFGRANAVVCPTCKEPRFTSQGAPRKQIQYAPFLFRLQRWFGVKRIAKFIREELARLLSTQFATISDIRETSYFKGHFADYDPDAQIPVAIRFTADAFRPFKYRPDVSFMLMAVTNLILSPKLRNGIGNFSVISLYQETPKSRFQLYLSIFASELVAMKNGSVTFWDAYKEKFLPLKLFFVSFTGDYFQMAKTLHTGSTNGDCGCIVCFGKRSFLSDVGCSVMLRFGENKTYDEITKIRSMQQYNFIHCKKDFDATRKETGVGGACVLDALGSELDPIANSLIDVMHASNNSLRIVVGLMKNDLANVVSQSGSCVCRREQLYKRIHAWSESNGAEPFANCEKFRASLSNIALKAMDKEFRSLEFPSFIDITTSAAVFDPDPSDNDKNLKFNYKFYNYFILARLNIVPALFDIVSCSHDLEISIEVAKTICNLFHLLDAINKDAFDGADYEWITKIVPSVYAQCVRFLDIPLFRMSFHLLFHVAMDLVRIGNLKSSSQFNLENKLGGFSRAVICPPRPAVALFSRITLIEFFGHLLVAKSFDMDSVCLNEFEQIWKAASDLEPMIRNEPAAVFSGPKFQQQLGMQDKQMLEGIVEVDVTCKVGKVFRTIHERSVVFATSERELKNAHVGVLESGFSTHLADPPIFGRIEALYWVDGNNVFANVALLETNPFGQFSLSHITTGRILEKRIFHLSLLSEPLILSNKWAPKVLLISARFNRHLEIDPEAESKININCNDNVLERFQNEPLPPCSCKSQKRGLAKAQMPPQRGKKKKK